MHKHPASLRQLRNELAARQGFAHRQADRLGDGVGRTLRTLVDLAAQLVLTLLFGDFFLCRHDDVPVLLRCRRISTARS